MYTRSSLIKIKYFKMIKRIAMIRKNTRLTKEQDDFLKKYGAEKKLTEGEVMRLAIDKLMKK